MNTNTRILVTDYDDIGCNLKEGYAPTIVQPKRYLGKETAFDKKSSFSVTKFISNGEDAQSFLRWWRDDLEFGTLPFYVELPIMGGLMKTQVYMENDLSPVMREGIHDAENIPMKLKMVNDIPNNTISITGIAKIGGTSSCTYDYGAGCIIQTIYKVDVSGVPIGSDINYKWTARGAEIVAGHGTDTITIETTGTKDVNYGVTVDVSDEVYTLYANITGYHTRTAGDITPISIESIYMNNTSILECDFNNSNGCLVQGNFLANIVGDVVGTLNYHWDILEGSFNSSGDDTNSFTISSTGIETVYPFKISLTITDDNTSDTLEYDGTFIRNNINEAPVITLIGGDIEISLGGTYTEFGATATDDGDGDLTNQIVTEDNIDINTTGVYTVTYNVVDSLGLAAEQVSRSVTVGNLQDPPIYQLIEDIVVDGGHFVVNSSPAGIAFNGELKTVADGDWDISPTDYPKDGTINLEGGNYIDTQWIAPDQQEWTLIGCYNVIKNVSYDIYAIHYKGNYKVDVYEGSGHVTTGEVPLELTKGDVHYVPPLDTWKIVEGTPSGMEIDHIIYEMDSFLNT